MNLLQTFVLAMASLVVMFTSVRYLFWKERAQKRDTVWPYLIWWTSFCVLFASFIWALVLFGRML